MQTTPLPHPVGWLRPRVPGRDLPVPESPARRWAIRAIALAALAATVGYLVWRTTSTLAPESWWLSGALLALEIHAAVGLALFAFSLWDVDRRPANRDVAETTARLAVLIPTYNEDLEVLTPTVAAAMAMRLPHETWVLDDGERPAVAALAARLGARYLARTEHPHAKAGNVNHALGVIDADFAAILDADHVADPDFLVRTLGYFDDPRVALVQTPQEFYNLESFEHEGGGRPRAGVDHDGQRFHEQTLFYRILQPGKNRWDAAFWCGTGAVVRVAALREVGLVATDTITEDIHTTIRFHRAGWRTVYHNEVLARGLAAADADTYQLQRLRWGIGAMQVLRTENPLVVSGLALRQRLAYGATLLGWFDAWRSLGYLILPAVVLLTGAVPIRAEPGIFLAAFGITFILQQLALRVLSRGAHRPILSILFELVRMTPNLLATTTLVTNRRATFKVTPKGRTGAGDGRARVRVPLPLRAALILSVAAAAWYAATLAGWTPTTYAVPWAAHGAFGWLLLNVVLLVLAMRRVRSSRFAGERRSSVRFETDLAGRIDGLAVRIRDLSLTGGRVEVAGGDPARVPPTGLPVDLVVEAGAGGPIVLRSAVRSAWPSADGGTTLGLEFAPDQTLARAQLSLALFGARADRPAGRQRAERTAERAIDVLVEAPVEVPGLAGA